MLNDPIVEEIRAGREAYSAKFGHDLRKIVRDLRKKQAKRTAKAKPAERKRRAA